MQYFSYFYPLQILIEINLIAKIHSFMKDAEYVVFILKRFFNLMINQLNESSFLGSLECFISYCLAHLSQLKLSSIQSNRIKMNRKNPHFINQTKEEEYGS